MGYEWKVIFCEMCEKEIPVEELENGTLVIYCPNCTGECVTCDCYLARDCFSDRSTIRFQPYQNRFSWE